MDATCWKIIGIAGVLLSAVVAALKIVWSKYQTSLADHRRTLQQLSDSQDARIKVLEALKDYATKHGP